MLALTRFQNGYAVKLIQIFLNSIDFANADFHVRSNPSGLGLIFGGFWTWNFSQSVCQRIKLNLALLFFAKLK
jgi:hypothetical protein